MIDKRIFYCWFGGGEMSDLNKRCIESWHKYCSEYEIVEINEDNYDVNLTPYSAEAYEHGNWSYVSNAARLYYLLNKGGGIYIDTDIQLVKSLDSLLQYDKGFITEFESGQPDSGILGCGADGSAFFEEVYSRLLPGTVLHKEFIQVLFRDYDIHGENIVTYDDGFTVLGEQYIPTVRTGLFTKDTIAIHHFENTWVKQWREITDGFYPFTRVKATLGYKLMHEDKDAVVNMQIKNLYKNWSDADMIGRMNYFFNPKVVRLVCKDFDAERIEYDHSKELKTTITPGGLIVYSEV